MAKQEVVFHPLVYGFNHAVGESDILLGNHSADFDFAVFDGGTDKTFVFNAIVHKQGCVRAFLFEKTAGIDGTQVFK